MQSTYAVSCARMRITATCFCLIAMGCFTSAFAAAPSIAPPVNPSSGDFLGGTAVTITGSNFVSGATVTFGPNPAVGGVGSVFANVPEAANYALIYQLPIANKADFLNNAIGYTVDNSAGVNYQFDRIAYYLELDDGTGLKYAYVSMDAFTTDATKIGVPNLASGEFYQQDVSNMNVVSTMPGVLNGTGLDGGNIEFWATNYGPNNSIGIPNANNNTFDFGDVPTPGNYGSMQIHNHFVTPITGQTIIAYNNWNNLSQNSDLGIGNQPSGNPDWTFANSAGTYTVVKNLQILVHPVTSGPVAATFNSASSLTATTVAPATGFPLGLTSVTVTNPDLSTVTAPNAFTFTAGAPAFVVAPNAGSALGGTPVTLSGSNFAPGFTATFNGIPIALTSQSPSTLTFNTPAMAGTTAAVNVVVTNTDGQSATQTFTYSLRTPDLISTAGLVNGIAYKYFDNNPNESVIPNNPSIGTPNAPSDPNAYETLGRVPFSIGVLTAGQFGGQQICFGSTVNPGPSGIDGGNLISPQTQGTTNFNFKWSGYVNIASDGLYTFGTSSDDGSLLFVGNTVVVNNNNGQGTKDRSGQIGLKAGLHQITMLYTQGGGGFDMAARFSGPSIVFDFIPDSILFTDPIPVITGINPAQGPFFGSPVQIQGSGFTPGPMTIDFGGNSPTGVSVLSDTAINLTTPSGTIGAATVTVTNRLGYSGSSNGFTYQDVQPTVTGVIPNSGAISGGTNVTIVGTNFYKTATVTFGGVAATNVAYVNTTALTATTPAGAAGPADVTVTNSTLSGTLTGGFTYGPRQPDNPAVTQAGVQFKYYQAQGFNGLPIPDFSTLYPFSSGIVANCTIPLSPTGTVPPNPFENARQNNWSVQFTGYISVPTNDTYIFNTTSDDGSRLFIGDTLVVDNNMTQGPTTISGQIALLAGLHRFTVQFAQGGGGFDLEVQYSSSTILLQDIPDAAFFCDPPPTVTSLDVTSGPAAGNTAITVTGTGFVPGSLVGVGGTVATNIVFVNSTTLTASTPAGAIGATNVVVVNNNSNASSGTLVNGFTYTNTGRTPENPILTQGGLFFSYYQTSAVGGTLPNFGALTPATTGIVVNPDSGPTLNQPQPGQVLPSQPYWFSNTNPFEPARANNWSAVYSGYVTVPTSDTYTFYTGSDDGSRLFIGSTLVVDNDFSQGVFERSGQIALLAGTHRITIQYGQGNGGYALYVNYSNTTTLPAEQAIPNGAFSTDPTPTFTSINPAMGPTVGGTAFTITGTNFVSGASVSIGGNAAVSTNVTSNTTLTAFTPPGVIGSANVNVINPGGPFVSQANAFTYVGTATHLIVSLPPSATSGTPFNATVSAVDANGNVDTLYTGTVHFTSNDPLGAVLPADYTFLSSDNGVKTFVNGFTLKTAGTDTVVSTDTVNAVISGSTLEPVNPGAPASVAVETKNDGTGVVVPAQILTSGNSITVFSIRRDANGNFVDNVAASSWSLNSVVGGVAPGDLVAAGNLKSATFTGHLVGSANIHASSAALPATDSGTITVVVNAPVSVSVETKNDGTGVVVPAQNLASGSSITVFSIRRDANGNFIDNVAASSWSLTSITGGVVAGDLVAAGNLKSATFTGNLVGSAIIHATSAALATNDSGVITVVAGAAVSVSVETKNDGSGVVVPAQNLVSGSAIVVFSIRRDAKGNFVDNVAADSWSLSSITGGVAAGDLVAAGNLKSATFTGHAVGSAAIHAPSGALATTDSGVITVVPSASVTTVASSVTPSSAFQQPVIFTATISGGGVVPTGSVVFTIDNGAPSAPVALANGSALITVSTLSVTAAGAPPHNIAAAYSGDANHTASAGNVSQTVNQAGTNTVVAAVGNPVPFGQSVVLNTSVAPVPAGPVLPTGSVNIAFGNQSKTVALNGGAASLTIPGLTPGNYTITVTYLGDSNFTQSVSSSFTETISDVAPVANPQSVVVGQNTQIVIALTGSDSLGNPIAFAIATQPAQGTLTANPATAPVGTVFTYTPAPGFVGNDSFTFTTTDGFLTSLPATVGILVTPPPSFGSPPSITPNPALAGQQIVFQFSATSPLGPVIITWNFGDGTTGTGTTVTHTYTQPGAYTLTVTATAPSGAASVIPMEVFVGNALTGSSLNGVSGNGTLAPGDTGIIVGAPGIGKASGGAAKLHVDYVHRTKTKFTGQVGTVNFPPLVAQGGLAGLPGIVIVGTPPNAPAYYVTVNSKGRGKATGMLFKIDSKKQLIQFTASGRPELTNLIEAIGGAFVPNTKNGPTNYSRFQSQCNLETCFSRP